MAPRFVAKQLASPVGIGGAIIRALMNRSNARMNRCCFEQLAIGRDDRVLEVGLGGGAALRQLLANAARVCGVDRSPDVVAWAAVQFADAASAGRAEFRIGAVEELPAADAEFDKVLSVNTVYFWNSLASGMREIARVLAPGGRVVLGFVPKNRMDRMNMPPEIFTLRRTEDVVAAVREAGLTAAEIEAADPQGRWAVVTGIRS